MESEDCRGTGSSVQTLPAQARCLTFPPQAQWPFVQNHLLPLWLIWSCRPCIGRLGGGSQQSSPLPALPLASLVRLYGRHMETVSIYPVPPGCCCMLCSSEQKPRVPAGPLGRPHVMQPAVLQGASGPCYISAEEVLPSVQTGHPGVPARPRDAELLPRAVSVTVLFSNAC